MRKYESWAQAIVSERKRARKTQSELGELCGVNPANLRKYESGRQNPKYETVERIAQALGVQMWKNKEIYVQDEGKRDVRNCDMPQETEDWLDRIVTWARYEIAKAGNVPEKLVWGEFEPPRDDGDTWNWLGFDALKIKNPEVMILGKDGGKMERNVKGIGEAALLAALFNAAKPDKQDAMYSRHESMTKEEASALLDELSGHNANTPVRIEKLYGRYILMTFWPGMTKINGTGYDAQNGWGKAAEVVESMRREIAAKKNAERKAERAKRHRVAVYWQDDNDGICTVADGHSEHQNIMAAAYLLGTMLADVQEERRSAEYNGAIMRVDEIIRECGRKDGGNNE